MTPRETLFAVLAGLLVWLGTWATAAADTGSLDLAYKKEFAYLEAERASLSERLNSVEAEGLAAIAAAEAEIQRLQAQLLGLGTEAEALEDRLLELERREERQSEQADTLNRTVAQAVASLGKFTPALSAAPEEDLDAARETLAAAFQEAGKILTRLGLPLKEAGEFFLADGVRVSGEIIRVGQVAAYGVSAAGGGVLVPAGGGHLKVWDAGSVHAARSLANGEALERLPVFIFENADRAVEAKAGKTVGDVIASGGAIAYVIVALGLMALGMILLRFWFLLRASSRTDELVAQILPLVQEGWRDEALAVCQKQRGAAGRVLTATVRNLERDREHLEDIVSEAILHEMPYLDRFGAIILVLAAVAPLLGLLGTVTGMISTFDVITEFGAGDPKLLSGGISEALVTTELGLIVAIPTLLLGNILSGWSSRIKTSLEHASLRVVNTYEIRGLEKVALYETAVVGSDPAHDDPAHDDTNGTTRE